MIAQNPYARYQQIQTETADGLDLVIMLYRGAIRMLGQAEEAITAGVNADAHNWLLRVQEIIRELDLTLNLDAGEIAVNLQRLYAYMTERLIEANISKDREPVLEVRGLLNDLLDAWLDTRDNVKPQAAKAPAAFAAA